MNIVYKKLNDLHPYEKNPRKNDDAVKYVQESIREFGFKVPIVIDNNGVIVAGHTRWKAAQNLNMQEVPCIVADDLNEQQIKAFRLADNKVSEKAEWDFDLLSDELDDLFDFDMTLFGFDDVLEDEEPVEVKEDDFEAELPEEPKAKLGDIYQLGNHRLMCGDSTNVLNFDKLFNGKNIDLVLTDPPYGISVVQGSKVGGGGKLHFGNVVGANWVEASDYIPIKGDETTETAMRFYNSCVSAGIQNYIIFGGNYFTDFLEPKSCWIVWDKENTGNFADVELAWTSFDKGAKLYRWLWNGLCRKGARNVEGKSRVHPTQKPVGLIGEILKDFSEQGDNIFDGFGGSGSTLIACEQANRNCFMIEYEPHYIDVIIARWEKFTGKKAVLLNGKL